MADLMLPRSRETTDTIFGFGDGIDSDPPPLWLNKNSFLEQNFDPQAHIADNHRSGFFFVPLHNLKSELVSHLSSLNHELVDLINRDYAEFVSLSTNLVDVVDRAAALQITRPLMELREKITEVRVGVGSSLEALQNGLRRRAEASSAREVLEVLIDTSHVVSKVEKLIKELPTLPIDGSVTSTESGGISSGGCLRRGGNGTYIRETQSMHLARIASEMNRLKFYMAHMQNLPFIENMGKRIQSASLLLDPSLGQCFVDGLVHRDANVIYNCLRAYATIGNTTDAEEIFRSTIVSPLIHQIIPHGTSQMGVGAIGDELEEDYKRMRIVIEKDCKFLLDISFSENSGFHVFNFLANSILKEVLSAIQKGKPGAFSPGRPTEFLKNYKSSLALVAFLEGYCPSRSAVSKFQSAAIYTEFMRQWNVEVYFSLRSQEIASALDSALLAASLIPVQDSKSEGESRNLTLAPSITLLECLRSCWREDVLVISYSDKFLRLSLQLLSRYSTWLSSGLGARKSDKKESNPGFKWAKSAIPEDFIYVIHDIDCLVTELCGDYLGRVLQHLSSCPVEVLDLVKHSILQGGKLLSDLVPLLSDTIKESLVQRSIEEYLPEFKQLYCSSSIYGMSNRPPPTGPSPYVSSVLQPLKNFLEGETATRLLKTEVRQELLVSAAKEITVCYHKYVADFINMAMTKESSLVNLRKIAQRRQGANLDVMDNNVDKLYMQLFLDTQEYGCNLAALGVTAANLPEYRALWQCVAPAGLGVTGANAPEYRSLWL